MSALSALWLTRKMDPVSVTPPFARTSATFSDAVSMTLLSATRIA